MTKLHIEVNDYNLAQSYSPQIWAGRAFAFIAAAPANNDLQAGLENFYGIPPVVTRRTLPLLLGGQQFPGFSVRPETKPLKIAPVLLTDKEIYRAGQDSVKLLIVSPLLNKSEPSIKYQVSSIKEPETRNFTLDNRQPTTDNPSTTPNSQLATPSPTTRIVVENNGAVYQSRMVNLDRGGLTLLDLGKLPEGGYRVYWEGEEGQDWKGDKAECHFSSVEYVLSPLQATLLAHELREKKLACRLKVERFNEPLNSQVQIELWSGSQRLGQDKIKPETPGIYNVEFKVKANAEERLELRVSYLDALATAVIPGSRKAERDETLLAGLGREVRASLMPRSGAREVRGLYLSEDGPVNNSPVSLQDPAPNNRKTQIKWQTAAQSARLLILDMAGKIVQDEDLGEVSAGQTIEIEVPAPGGWLAVGGWLGDKAWEGWASLLAPSKASLEIIAPATAKPGQEIEIGLKANNPASVYLLVRDSRLSGAGPKEKLAAAIKRGLEGAEKWGDNGYVKQTLDQHPDWPSGYHSYGGGFNTGMMYAMSATPAPFPPAMPAPMAGRPSGMSAPRMMASASNMRFKEVEEAAQFELLRVESRPDFNSHVTLETIGKEAEVIDPRRDFADIAFCAILKTDPNGQVSQKVKLPDAISSYVIEAFALSEDGAEWANARENLEVSQPVWAEFKLPAFVYPGDSSPATLEIGSAGGQFRLKLTCDGLPVAFSLQGAKQTATATYSGQRAKVSFEARPGRWQVEIEDLVSGERDVSERIVQAIGQFKVLAKRFQLMTTGETLAREAAGVIMFRLLPSLDKPFNLLCDATASYEHRCCEQTAAKLIAAIGAWMSGGNDQAKLREVIRVGVEREKTMFVPNRGFAMYPPSESGGTANFNEHWGKMAAEHLNSLASIGQPLLGGDDPAIIHSLREAIAMGEEAAKIYKLPGLPTNVTSGREAYQVINGKGAARTEALRIARKVLSEAEQQGNRPQPIPHYGRVENRAEQAYAAAALLIGGDSADLGSALKAANRLANSLDGNGRLYSTVDSVAFISLMSALKAAGIGANGSGRVRLDGREMTTTQAISEAEAGLNREITVLEGVALVELTTEITEDWNAFRPEVPVSVQLSRVGRVVGRGLRLGDNLELSVKIQKYEAGQLVHLCLPPALSRIEGGGEVKKFSVDFAGNTEVKIPLRATGYTRPDGEHWAILVRNMFKEEQAGNPGLQTVQISSD